MKGWNTDGYIRYLLWTTEGIKNSEVYERYATGSIFL